MKELGQSLSPEQTQIKLEQISGSRNAPVLARPNGLALSCAALIDRENVRAASCFQKTPDLARRAAASAGAPCWATTRFRLYEAVLIRSRFWLIAIVVEQNT
jgi:hypothetical protein